MTEIRRSLLAAVAAAALASPALAQQVVPAQPSDQPHDTAPGIPEVLGDDDGAPSQGEEPGVRRIQDQSGGGTQQSEEPHEDAPGIPEVLGDDEEDAADAQAPDRRRGDAREGRRMKGGGGFHSMMGGAPGMRSGPMMGMHGMMRDPGRHIEGRLAFLKAEIGVGEEQEDEWEAFANAAREAAQGMRAAHAEMRAQDGPPSLPDRLALMESMMSARLEAVRGVREEATALYEALDAEQKRAADALMGGM